MIVSMHPIQLAYRVTSNGNQFCELCGDAEVWTATHDPGVSGEALERNLHLIHLVSSHISEVQWTLTAEGKKEEIRIAIEANHVG